MNQTKPNKVPIKKGKQPSPIASHFPFLPVTRLKEQAMPLFSSCYAVGSKLLGQQLVLVVEQDSHIVLMAYLKFVCKHLIHCLI
jgi:hypothetical protein